MIVYLITSQVNNKQYVGQSKYDNPEYFGSGSLIKKAIKKYGKNNFTKEILCKCDSRDELNEMEIYFIDILNTLYPNGYNFDNGGYLSCGSKHPAVGDKISKTKNGVKSKLRNKTYEEIYGEEEAIKQKAKRSKGFANHKLDCQCSICKNIRGELIGVKRTDITKQRLSESHKGNTLDKFHKSNCQCGVCKTKRRETAPWNKNLTKDTDPRLKKVSEAQKDTFPTNHKSDCPCCVCMAIRNKHA